MACEQTLTGCTHLRGWHGSLPSWLADACRGGQIRIVTVIDTRYGECQVLHGTIRSPHGHVIEFQ